MRNNRPRIARSVIAAMSASRGQKDLCASSCCITSPAALQFAGDTSHASAGPNAPTVFVLGGAGIQKRNRVSFARAACARRSRSREASSASCNTSTRWRWIAAQALEQVLLLGKRCAHRRASPAPAVPAKWAAARLTSVAPSRHRGRAARPMHARCAGRRRSPPPTARRAARSRLQSARAWAADAGAR